VVTGWVTQEEMADIIRRHKRKGAWDGGTLEEAKRRHAAECVAWHDGCMRAAARALGCSPTTLYRLMEKPK